MKKIIAYNLVMWSLGLIVFAALASLVQWRIGQTIATEPELQGFARQGATVKDIGLTSLAEGIHTSVQESIKHLETNERMKAAHALDGALRVADVGQHASHGLTAFYFEAIHGMIKKARVALQNGSPGQGLIRLTRLDDVLYELEFPQKEPQTPTDVFGQYEGAKVISTRGARIGEIRSIESKNGKIRSVIIRPQNKADFLGFIDLNGEEITVPGKNLVFGPARSLGASMVAVQLAP